MTSRILAQAPSNIALIKYMGKQDAGLNLPANPSLSLTLSSLCSFAEVERVNPTDPARSITWKPQVPRDLPFAAKSPVLNDVGIARIIRHVERVRMALPAVFAPFQLKADISGALELCAANTFPEASGIASSASSFAAVTLAVAATCAEDPLAFKRVFETDLKLRRALAVISRQGSGSSCRSFEGPWVVWQGEQASAITENVLPPLTDLVILVASEPKAVSSSQAHARVLSSPLWAGRPHRASQRVAELRAALEKGDLAAVSQVAWQEFWEMHSLFHTAQEPFTYWAPGTLEVLQWLKAERDAAAIKPIVTMDAGPNVHVLVPSDQASAWRKRLEERFSHFRILEDPQGLGASLKMLKG